MSSSTSASLLARAARALDGRWLTIEGLARELYGPGGTGRSERMSRMVRARRPVNRMKALGVVTSRAGSSAPEYTLLPEGRFLCSLKTT